jgi:dipeptidyl aminopeptidase/acylaminoacyl peptidase
MPAVSRNGQRLAFTAQTLSNANIWEVRFSDRTRPSMPPTKLISSSRTQGSPAFSADDRRLAFESTRSGSSEIWVSDADGSDATVLTSFGGPWTGSPTWSPDGQFLAFDSRAQGHSSIYVIPSAGGRPKRVATGVDDSSEPRWSIDGKWLYFTGQVRGVDEIFKIAVKGGAPTQLTTHGGTHPSVSPFHPTRIYYTSAGTICSTIIDGGDERCLSTFPRLGPEYSDAWALSSTGIYFIDVHPTRAQIAFFEFASDRVVPVSDLAGRPLPWGANPALSHDGRRLLYAQLDAIASDIMLVDDTRWPSR